MPDFKSTVSGNGARAENGNKIINLSLKMRFREAVKESRAEPAGVMRSPCRSAITGRAYWIPRSTCQKKNIAVFGFEDTQGNPYFLSFHVTGVGGVLGGVVGGVIGGVAGGVGGGVASEKELAEFAKGAVKAEGSIAPPKLIKYVEPVYPEIARLRQPYLR